MNPNDRPREDWVLGIGFIHFETVQTQTRKTAGEREIMTRVGIEPHRAAAPPRLQPPSWHPLLPPGQASGGMSCCAQSMENRGQSWRRQSSRRLSPRLTAPSKDATANHRYNMSVCVLALDVRMSRAGHQMIVHRHMTKDRTGQGSGGRSPEKKQIGKTLCFLRGFLLLPCYCLQGTSKLPRG